MWAAGGGALAVALCGRGLEGGDLLLREPPVVRAAVVPLRPAQGAQEGLLLRVKGQELAAGGLGDTGCRWCRWCWWCWWRWCVMHGWGFDRRLLNGACGLLARLLLLALNSSSFHRWWSL